MKEKTALIRIDSDQNSSNIIKKRYLNNKEIKFNLPENNNCSEEHKKYRPATQGCIKAEKISDFSIINNTIDGITEKDENDASSEKFYTERDKVEIFYTEGTKKKGF